MLIALPGLLAYLLVYKFIIGIYLLQRFYKINLRFLHIFYKEGLMLSTGQCCTEHTSYLLDEMDFSWQ